MSWVAYALISATAAALMAILAKVGVEGVPSTLATAMRTIRQAQFADHHHAGYLLASGTCELAGWGLNCGFSDAVYDITSAFKEGKTYKLRKKTDLYQDFRMLRP